MKSPNLNYSELLDLSDFATCIHTLLVANKTMTADTGQLNPDNKN